MTIIRWAGALALALLLCAPGAALAQVSPSVKAQTPAGYLPGTANFCSADSGVTWTPCSGGGGGGGGDASATNQTTQIAAEQAIRDRIGALTSPAAGSTNDLLEKIRALAADTGAVLTTTTPATTEVRTNVAASTSSTLLLAANPNRLGCSVTFDSAAITYVGLSSGVSATSYKWAIDAKTTVGGSIECPYRWTGPVYAAWASATGTARVSELTP